MAAATRPQTGVAGRMGALTIMALLAVSAAGRASAANTDVMPEQLAPTSARLAAAGAALEEAISGDNYRLGPGDSLTIGIWGLEPTHEDVAVTVEGRLVLPMVGELDVNGLFLNEARRLIIGEIMKHFHDVDITVTLKGVRRFQVHVLGQVERPGTYLGTAVDRVSAAVSWTGELAPNASLRRVTVFNGDSIRAHADLFAFLQRGLPRANPRLQDGDRIYVPYVRHRFTVQGAVNAPTRYEYIEGDRFCDAITFAGGFTPEVFPDTIEVARYLGADRHAVRFFAIAGGDLVPARPQDEPYLPPWAGRFYVPKGRYGNTANLDYPDFELSPDDVIFVRSIPEYRVKRLVHITGEVVYPGWYAISEGESRLADVIRRAGGVTDEAFLTEATLVRSEAIALEDKEFERLKVIPAADMTEDEYEYFKLRSRENPGLMVVDFGALLLDNDDGHNLLLRGGDVIHVPMQRDFVSVLGMVGSPGNILFASEIAPKDYIRMAGGYAEKADKGKTRVIKASGGEWVSLSDVERIEPGDTIWVPETRDREYWQTFKDVISVTTQIVTIYLVVDRAINK